MKYWSLSIFSWIFVLSFAQAQNDADSLSMQEQDSLAMVITSMPVDSTLYVEADSIAPPIDTSSLPLPPRRNFQPQFFFDYGKLIPTIIGWEEKWEGGASLLFFNRFEATAEFGKAALRPEHAYTNGYYESKGTYLRFGGGLMTDINAKSSIGLGVRYGYSQYSDKGAFSNISPSGLQDDKYISLDRPNGDDFTARWWSLVLTSESRIIFNKSNPNAKINQLLKLGFFFRMRFLVTHDNDPYPVNVYSIPGYGSVNNRQQAAFNVFIKFTP